MGASASLLGLGFGLAAVLRSRFGQGEDAPLLDMDFEHRRYAAAGASHTSEAAFLTAVGGVRSGSAVTLGPTLVGPELVPNGDFATGIVGWSAALNAPVLDHSAGKLRMTSTAAGQGRFSAPVPCTVGKAYRIGMSPVVTSHGQSALASFSANAELSGSGTTISSDPGFAYGGAVAGPMYVGGSMAATAAGQWSEWDNFSVREVVPLAGHNPEALAGIITAVTPAAAAGNKVLFQADDAAVANGTPQERNRIRLVWDAGGHLRLIVTFANTEVVNLDLGLLDASTAFSVAFSASAESFLASRDGGVVALDSSGAMPPVAAWRIGRSNTGEAWDGAIRRIRLYGNPVSGLDMIDPQRAFAIYGDSTAAGHGSGVTLTWFEALRSGYAPRRSLYNAGVGGQAITTMRDGLLADTAHRRWTTIIMDRPNTGETGEAWIAAVKAAVARLQTDRWLVVPPVLNSPAGLPDNSATAIAEAQATLLSDSFFLGHTFDASAQAAYASALSPDATRTDGIHFSDAGQSIQAAAIRAFLDEKGW